MKAGHSHRSRSISFKITAMVDMAFLLITFFIMSIRLGQQGEELVKLPNADQARAVTTQFLDQVQQVGLGAAQPIRVHVVGKH